jgi:hypothetical protein
MKRHLLPLAVVVVATAVSLVFAMAGPIWP